MGSLPNPIDTARTVLRLFILAFLYEIATIAVGSAALGLGARWWVVVPAILVAIVTLVLTLRWFHIVSGTIAIIKALSDNEPT
jgi:uncharacterized membrane protein